MTAGRRQRIAYVNHTGQVSGAEAILLTMLRGLDRKQYHPVVICPAEQGLRSAVEAEGVEWVAMPALVARFTWRPDRLLRYAASLAGTIVALRRVIRRLDPDMVHANTIRAGIAVTLATAGTRRMVLWHAHDILPRHPLSSAIRTLAFLSPGTSILAVSLATGRAFRGRLPFGKRIQVLYNGSDLSRFPMKRPGDAPLKQELGIAEDSFLICTAGQICARKGQRELVEAFARCAASSPRMHLAIAGKALFPHDEAYRDQLIDQVKAEGLQDRVHFLGQRGDIPSVLRSADLFVLNSRQEPFGLVLIEAMASGTPVLATRVGGIPEIVTDSVNGWLIEKDDTAGLAAKLMELAQTPAMLASVVNTARDLTCPGFSVAQFHARLSRCYRKLAQEHSRTQSAQADRVLEMQ